MGGPGKLVRMDSFEYGEDNLNEKDMARKICYLLGMTPEEWTQFRMSVKRQAQRCDTMEEVVRQTCCPGNKLYSRITIDDLSDKTRIELDQIRTGLGAPYTDTFPVAPGQKIRLFHQARPGYTPTKMMIDFNLANNGNNYLDLSVQWFLVTNELDTGRDLGSVYSGNDFIQKDGSQIHVPFPTYRNKVVDVGSLERLAVEITHKGAVNALNSARVRLFYDHSDFYELCRKRCEGDCDTSC